LPDSIETKASRLHGVALEMALKEPVIDVDVALGHDPATVLVRTDFDDPVEHQHGGRRKPGLQALGCILHQTTVRKGQQLVFVEMCPAFESFVFHRSASSPKRAR
jgi:hypothetical protein